MDLCILSDISDFVAIKAPFCIVCAENKLNTKILHSLKLSPKDFLQMKKEYNLRGVSIKCQC